MYPTSANPDGRPTRVVVVGGGLAGMAAAVALQSLGVAVTLLESRKSLGGRAGSFTDPESGEELDNCQHVLLGCCTNLLDFYRRIGAQDRVGFERGMNFLDARGRRFVLSGTPGLPAPLHLAASIAAFGAISLGNRAALVRAMLAMLRMGRGERDALHDTSFGEWLDGHAQPRELVDGFYEAILVSALNETCRRVSAAFAIQVFQDAILSNALGYRLGLPTCPLGQLYASLPVQDVRTGVRAAGLVFETGRCAGVELADGQRLAADAVVLATNHHNVRRWLPEELAARDERFARLHELQSVPILGAHLWFDRPVLPWSHAALLRGPLQWVFRKDREGRAVHGVISAAREWVDRPRGEAISAFEFQLRSVLPGAIHATVQRSVVVIEKRATYSPVPGVNRLRPRQGPGPGGIPGLYLAGDYTLTDWPATMEGAVRSGYLAAEAIAADFLPPPAPRFVVPDLPIQFPARFLAPSHARR